MIREMLQSDWDRVAYIFATELEKGYSNFDTECPSYEAWDKSHHKDCRFVYITDDKVVGWIAISPTSSRCAFLGSVEVSIYIDQDYHRRGIGTALMKALIAEAQKKGYWSLYSVIFSINQGSIALHKKCGFREIGYRERIAKDRFGVWQNVTLMELRLEDPEE
jgi:L-amino acid N-acyltransferase YncA